MSLFQVLRRERRLYKPEESALNPGHLLLLILLKPPETLQEAHLIEELMGILAQLSKKRRMQQIWFHYEKSKAEE